MEENNEVRKSLFVRIFEYVIRFILHFRVLVLMLIALGTAFFIWALFSLQIDANIFSFASNVPASVQVPTPSEAPKGEPLVYELPDDYVKYTPPLRNSLQKSHTA